MKTFAELSQWCRGAIEQGLDPSEFTCQLHLKWREDPTKVDGPELACGMVAGTLLVALGPGFPALPMPTVVGAPVIAEDAITGEQSLVSYGLEELVPGVWAVEPSLNVEGLVHGFLVLYGVPDPAPWGRRIILA